MINISSETQYISKKYSSEKKTGNAARDAASLDEVSSEEIKRGVIGLVSILPNLKDFIAPTLNVIHGIQSIVGDSNMKEKI